MQDHVWARCLPGRRDRTSRAWLALSSLPLALALGAREAHADCAPPDPAIVWSYPAHGDTDVPTNVDLWVLPSGWGAPAVVTRDGVALTPLRMGYGYDAGELEPNTSHTFRVELDVSGEAASSFELTFTTGSGPAAADASAAPGDIVPSSGPERALSERCNAALSTQDCFDQGQDTYFQFTPSGDAKGWVLMTDSSFRPLIIWPGECGAPTLFDGSHRAPCATLYGIDAAGQLHAGQHVCAETGTSPDQSASGPGEPPSTVAAPRPDAEPATQPRGEPSAAGDPATPATSRGSATNPVQSSSEGGCSLANPRSPRAPNAALGLGLALAVLARIGRRAAQR
jgi:hypothetical protein